MWQLTIPLSPGVGRQNARYAGKMRLSKQYRTFLDGIRYAALQAKIPLPVPCSTVGVSVVAYWPRRHRQSGLEGVPYGDVDAPIKGVLDGLEKAGVYTNDACVLALTVHKKYDAAHPRVEVEIWEMKDVEP